MADLFEQSAGKYSAWLRATRSALLNNSGVDVPCGTCNACCRSALFIHIQPGEKETRACIPAALLFPAPGLGEGHMVLGYDEQGHCPLLENESCSIYDQRPQTCRTYDCRIFPATDIKLTDQGKSAILEQTQRWKFTTDTSHDREKQTAVQQAAVFIQDHVHLFPPDTMPETQTHIALMAIKVYELFLLGDHQLQSDEGLVQSMVEVKHHAEPPA